MFQTEFARRSSCAPDGGAGPRTLTIARGTPGDSDARGVVPLVWEEHCTECAYPTCYGTCALYRPRPDGHCARFTNGIEPVVDGGERAYRIGFERWAKLEAQLPARPVETPRRLLHGAEPVERLLVGGVARIPHERLRAGALSRWGAGRSAVLARSGRRRDALPAGLLVDVSSDDAEPWRLIVETTGAAGPTRTSVTVAPGRSRQLLGAASIGITDTRWPDRILLYPENDRVSELIVHRLELVYVDRAHDDAPSQVPATGALPEPLRVSAPAGFVKCVVIDLDNTIWDGTLVDVGPGVLTLRAGVADSLRSLDERGILLSIASKNDREPALAELERLGIRDLFLHPQIGWGPKSAAIREIVRSLNIGLESFAFVDDQPFERGEVGEQLGAIRVFDERDLLSLAGRPEFDVPVTHESRGRRGLYQLEAERRELVESYQGDYDAFLRSCDIRLRVLEPDESTLERCAELMARTNQLNLTTRRLTRADLEVLLSTPGILVVGLDAKDRFGAYGIIGVAVVDRRCEPVLTDFVTSCRVAQKGIEAGFFEWLRSELAPAQAGEPEYRWLRARFLATERNHLLREVLSEVGFESASVVGDGGGDSDGEDLRLSLTVAVPRGDIVTVDGGL